MTKEYAQRYGIGFSGANALQFRTIAWCQLVVLNRSCLVLQFRSMSYSARLLEEVIFGRCTQLERSVVLRDSPVGSGVPASLYGQTLSQVKNGSI